MKLLGPNRGEHCRRTAPRTPSRSARCIDMRAPSCDKSVGARALIVDVWQKAVGGALGVDGVGDGAREAQRKARTVLDACGN